MTRDDGTQNDGDQPGDKDKKPKGKSSFVPRWRQNQVEPLNTPPASEDPPKKPSKFQAKWRQNTVEPAPEIPPAPAPAPATTPAPQPKPAKKKFEPRWRQHTAEEPEVQVQSAPDPEPRVHPNLQQQPAENATGKRFQPRWRQRAEEIAAKEEEARAQAPPITDKPGFEPRWRRTAAGGPAPGAEVGPLPGSDAPLEGQAPKAKGFKPGWRERAEREVVVPAPKAEFTPRWKRTVAAEQPPPVEVPPVAPEAPPPEPVPVESVPVEVVAEARLELITETVAEAPATAPVAEVANLELGAPAAAELFEFFPDRSEEPTLVIPLTTDPIEPAGPPSGGLAAPLAAPLALALAAPLAAPLAPTPDEETPDEKTTTELVAEAPIEVVAPQPEKKRLPRPQAPPPPKAAPPPAPVPEVPAAGPRPIVPIPNTEDDDYQPAAAVVPAFLPGPEVLEARVEKAKIERSTLVETELVDTPRKPKRLDDEAIAALKATANLVTKGAPIPGAAPPPAPPSAAPPPPPPPPVQAPRYVPTPKPASSRSITVAGQKAPPPSTDKSGKKKKFLFWHIKEKPPGLDEIATFTRQFSVMIGAGLPIHQALSFFAESSTGPLADITDDIATKISSGHRLSQAMGKHEAAFSEVYVGLIELGETSSHIDEALEKLADLLEKQVRLGKRLSSALVYPAFLVAVSLASIGVFLQYVLPTMIPLFAGFGMQLPLPTRMLLGSRHLVIPGAILAVLLVFFWQWFRPKLQRARRTKEKWAYKADKAMMKLPLFGKFFHQMAVARVLFALATMIETGLPILNAIKRCETVASNLAFAERLEKAGAELRDGATVTDALALYEVLPPSCLHLLSAGEESAQMAEMVQYAARFYEEEVEHSIDTFMSLVEPVIMIVMGIVVGFIVLSAVLPTVEMINHLGG